MDDDHLSLKECAAILIKEYGAMFRYGYLDPFLEEYSNEDSLYDETTKRFLKQVRETSGYDVDCRPHPRYYRSPFIPMEEEEYEGKRLAEEAIKSINRQVEKEGQHYELVKLERYIYVGGRPKLLTLLVKDCNGSEKRLRAGMMWYCQPNFKCFLEEWKDVSDDKGWKFVGEKEENAWRDALEEEEEVEDSSSSGDEGLQDGDVGVEVDKGSLEEDQTYEPPVKDSSIGVDKGLQDGDVGVGVEKGSIGKNQT